MYIYIYIYIYTYIYIYVYIYIYIVKDTSSNQHAAHVWTFLSNMVSYVMASQRIAQA